MENKVIVITGASSGIGAVLAKQLAERGARLALVARREGALREVADACDGCAVPFVADATVREDVRAVVEQSVERLGGIDVWVNNVGQGITRVPSELTDEDIDEMMRVNVKSALYGMQEVLPHFKSRGAGHVINVSSMLGRIPFAVYRSAYSGAKHYLNALTTNFRAEVQETHPAILFSLVSPGPVRTAFGLNARHGGIDSYTIPNAQSAGAVAAVVVDVIASPRDDVYTRAGSSAAVAEYYAGLGVDP